VSLRSVAALGAAVGLLLTSATAAPRGAAIVTLYRAPHPVGLMVTTGGWAYCEQARPIARRTGYALLCGRYAKDGYLGPGLRASRHLDWGNEQYLAGLADAVSAAHARIGGRLVLTGVSYSGFGVAALASRHPDLHPDAVIVVDSFLDLVARRGKLPDGHETAREIDIETGGSVRELRLRSVSVVGLAALVRTGTRLTVVWSVSEDERRFFRGATCDADANAATLSRLARTLGRPVAAWVTKSRHGVDFWRYGTAMVRGRPPGHPVTFLPGGNTPPEAICA
jgi:hypothetical protein